MRIIRLHEGNFKLILSMFGNIIVLLYVNEVSPMFRKLNVGILNYDKI